MATARRRTANTSAGSPLALRDGTVVGLRAVRTWDREAILTFLRGLSPESRFLRFCSAGADLEREASLMAEVVPPDVFAMVAVDDEGSIVGHAGYARIGPGRAETSVVVADELQRRGLGTALLLGVSWAAGRAGLVTLVGEAVSENHGIVALNRKLFPDVTVRYEDGWVHMEYQAPAEEPVVLQPAA